MKINSNKKFFYGKYLNVINNAISFASQYLKIPCEDFEMDINFVSTKEIKDLNAKFRNKDASTDVLSFPSLLKVGEGFEIIKKLKKENYPLDINLDTGNIYLGSICICKKIAFQHAKEYENSKLREIVYMAVHGFLHLLGFDHMNDDDKKIMRNHEEKIMEHVNLRRN